mmetsp:Transcript_43413/g.132094  ORF Transcript_43413/g.132094 Transcript_43413/m.132094 type:complete len:325 (+) Transcript_43413:192-1166(+)
MSSSPCSPIGTPPISLRRRRTDHTVRRSTNSDEGGGDHGRDCRSDRDRRFFDPRPPVRGVVGGVLRSSYRRRSDRESIDVRPDRTGIDRDGCPGRRIPRRRRGSRPRRGEFSTPTTTTTTSGTTARRSTKRGPIVRQGGPPSRCHYSSSRGATSRPNTASEPRPSRRPTSSCASRRRSPQERGRRCSGVEAFRRRRGRASSPNPFGASWSYRRGRSWSFRPSRPPPSPPPPPQQQRDHSTFLSASRPHPPHSSSPWYVCFARFDSSTIDRSEEHAEDVLRDCATLDVVVPTRLLVRGPNDNNDTLFVFKGKRRRQETRRMKGGC